MSCEIYTRFDGLFGPELRLRFRHRLRFRLGNGFRLGDRASFGDWLRLKGRPHLGKRFGLKIRTRFANSVPFGGSIRFEG
ncbi:hypothetical protein [Alistipes finegoldii]|uniref:hypothetical protein n=1 Tax=Alistipes finegoldii TaxID=214856 RepID=UPI003AF41A5B